MNDLKITKSKKMREILISILSIVFVIPLAYSQTLPQLLPALQDGWQRVYIKNVGSFDLPPSMEIQAGKYKEFLDEIKKIKGFDAPHIVAQQKGLNELEKEGFGKYARVMIETAMGARGEYEKLDYNISLLSQAEINALSSAFKRQLQQGFVGTGIKIIEWYPLKLEKVNGISCVHISYKRQLNNKPFVLVNMYTFQNYDRMHTLKLSYRLSEADYWKADFVTILKSFRITNIK